MGCCLGYLATWVKGWKCPSFFHIKAAQWLIHTSHCSLSEKPLLLLLLPCCTTPFLLLPHCFFSPRPLLLPPHCHWCCCVFFLWWLRPLLLPSSSCCIIVFEVSVSSSFCGASSSLPLDIVYCFVFWFALVLLLRYLCPPPLPCFCCSMFISVKNPYKSAIRMTHTDMDGQPICGFLKQFDYSVCEKSIQIDNPMSFF